MTNEKGWISRPPCNISQGCGKPSLLLIGNKFCCEEHLKKIMKKQEEAQEEFFKDL